MFTFGPITDWQGDLSVKQILVFPHLNMQEIFDHDYAALVERVGVQNASDSNLGAVYKLRALQYNGKYVASIRCGMTGLVIWESNPTKFDSPRRAFNAAVIELKGLLNSRLDSQINSTFSF